MNKNNNAVVGDPVDLIGGLTGSSIVLADLETCDNVDCGPGKRCKMNKRDKPRCVCAPDCSNPTWKGPVCGSDGKTYRSECALLRARCKRHPDLTAQYQGKCRSECLYYHDLHNCLTVLWFTSCNYVIIMRIVIYYT